MSDEMTFTLHNPLTEEEWDMITDVDFDHTQEITFHTKHGKEVVFVKRRKGVWFDPDDGKILTDGYCATCSVCGEWSEYLTAYCGNCGADMRGGQNED